MEVEPVKKREGIKSDLARLQEEMGDLFSRFFEGWEMPFLGRGRWPAIDIAEKEDKFLVKAEVPGCKAGDIDISVHGNMLIISGEKKEEEERKGKSCYHIERSCGSFRREFRLASEVDPGGIEAVCKDGVLSITLPKTEKAKPIKVRIKEE